MLDIYTFLSLETLFMNELLIKVRLLSRLFNTELINRKSLPKINIKGIDTSEDIECFYLEIMLKILALSVEMEKNLIMLGAKCEKGNEVGQRVGTEPLPEVEEDVPDDTDSKPTRISSY